MVTASARYSEAILFVGSPHDRVEISVQVLWENCDLVILVSFGRASVFYFLTGKGLSTFPQSESGSVWGILVGFLVSIILTVIFKDTSPVGFISFSLCFFSLPQHAKLEHIGFFNQLINMSWCLQKAKKRLTIIEVSQSNIWKSSSLDNRSKAVRPFLASF